MLKIGNPHGNLEIAYSIDSSWKSLYGSLLIISELSGALIPLIFLYSAKCRHHPASLILIICIYFKYIRFIGNDNLLLNIY